MTCWQEWKGGECPVDPDDIVDVRFDGGSIETDRAGSWHWAHMGSGCADIVAYRPTADLRYSTPYNRRPA